jgi:hypothetical protein
MSSSVICLFPNVILCFTEALRRLSADYSMAFSINYSKKAIHLYKMSADDVIK